MWLWEIRGQSTKYLPWEAPAVHCAPEASSPFVNAEQEEAKWFRSALSPAEAP